MSTETPEWDIPSWWTLKAFDNDTYTLTRVDGVVISSYKTSMMIWGWRFGEGIEHFSDRWDTGAIAEAAAQYPDPAEFLSAVDGHYPVET